ncbi:MAG: hypothetical protein RL308_2721 [Bacteroidota bacterium]|jgi:hypothetical protein
MIKLNEHITKIKTFCDFTIEYDRSNRTYLFNNQYIDDINCIEFEASIEEFKNELIDVCNDVKKPQNYLKVFLKEIEKIAVWYEKERINRFENFQKLSPIIVDSTNNKIREAKSKYTVEQIRLCTDAVDPNSDEMLFYLILNKSNTKNYKVIGDFERVKLHYVVTQYFKSIYCLVEYLLMLNDAEEQYGIEDFNQFRPLPKPQLKCNINLSKIETANLFKAFFETGYFYFDITNETQYKRSKIQFIENNFNYINQHGKLSHIGNLVKEFKDIDSFSEVENQIKIVQTLIDKLNEIQKSLENKVQKKTVKKFAGNSLEN